MYDCELLPKRYLQVQAPIIVMTVFLVIIDKLNGDLKVFSSNNGHIVHENSTPINIGFDEI